MKRTLLTLAFVLALSIAAPAQKAIIYSSTEAHPWQVSTIKADRGQGSKVEIEIYNDSLLQPVDGFGGTFSERGWDAMQVLTEQQRIDLMDELFGSDGIHFAWGRTPVGGNDMSLSTYTYNDVGYDWTQRNFSIARDRYILLPMIKLAKRVRPDLKMWASPWTPPYWMKISEHYSLKSHGINGTDVGHNRMDSHYWVYPNVTSFKMTDGCLRAYAIYLSRYLQAYKAEGIDIDILMPQNEVQWEPCWQSCTWRPQDLAIFVGKYLGPQLQQDSVATKLWLGTVNYPNPKWVFDFCENEETMRYIKGIGMQWTGMQAMPKVHERMPDMPLMQTEGICGDGDNSWADMERSLGRIIHCLNSGARAYMQWNMVLGDDLESLFGWKQNTLVIINRKTGHLTRTPEYWLLKHFSHFVQPGSRLVKTTVAPDAKECLCASFINHERRLVVVAYNPHEQPMTAKLEIKGKRLSINMQSKSPNTIVI